MLIALLVLLAGARASSENIEAAAPKDEKYKQARELLRATDLKSGNLTAKQQQDVAAAQKVVQEHDAKKAAERQQMREKSGELKRQRDALEAKKKSGKIKASEVGKLRRLRFEKRKQDAQLLFASRVAQAKLERKRSEGTPLTSEEEKTLTMLAANITQAEEKLQKRAKQANEGLKQAEQELRDLKNGTAATDKKTKWAKLKHALKKIDKMHDLLLSDAKQQVKQLTAIKEKYGISEAQESLLSASQDVVKTIEEARDKKKKMEKEISEKAKKKIAELQAKQEGGQALNVTEKEKLKRATKKQTHLRRKEKMEMLVRLDKLKKKAERGKKLSVKEEEEKKRIEEKLKAWKAEKKERSKKEKGQLAAAKAQAKALQTVKQKSTKQKQALDRARSQRYKQMQAKVKHLESKLRKYQRQRHNIFAKMFVPATKKKLAKAKAELKKLQQEIATEEAAARQIVASKPAGELTKKQKQQRREAKHALGQIDAVKLRAAKKKLAQVIKKGGNETAKAQKLREEIAALKQQRKTQKQTLKTKIQTANQTIQILKQQKATGAKLTDEQKKQLSEAKKTLQSAESKLLKARQNRVSRLMKKAERGQLTQAEQAKLQKAKAHVDAAIAKLQADEQRDEEKLQKVNSQMEAIQKKQEAGETLTSDESKQLQKLAESEKKLESRDVRRQRTKISVLTKQSQTSGSSPKVSQELEKAKTKKSARKAQLKLSSDKVQSGPKKAAQQFYDRALEQQKELQAQFLATLKEERQKLADLMAEMIPGKMDKQSRKAFKQTAKRLDEMLFYLKAMAKAKIPKAELDQRLKSKTAELQARLAKLKPKHVD